MNNIEDKNRIIMKKKNYKGGTTILEFDKILKNYIDDIDYSKKYYKYYNVSENKLNYEDLLLNKFKVLFSSIYNYDQQTLNKCLKILLNNNYIFNYHKIAISLLPHYIKLYNNSEIDKINNFLLEKTTTNTPNSKIENTLKYQIYLSYIYFLAGFIVKYKGLDKDNFINLIKSEKNKEIFNLSYNYIDNIIKKIYDDTNLQKPLSNEKEYKKQQSQVVQSPLQSPKQQSQVQPQVQPQVQLQVQQQQLKQQQEQAQAQAQQQQLEQQKREQQQQHAPPQEQALQQVLQQERIQQLEQQKREQQQQEQYQQYQQQQTQAQYKIDADNFLKEMISQLELQQSQKAKELLKTLRNNYDKKNSDIPKIVPIKFPGLYNT